jgi:hypothetical protein
MGKYRMYLIVRGYTRLTKIYVDIYKFACYRVGGQGGTELSRVTEEFNEMFGGESNEDAWHWFLPLQVEFPPGMQKVVLGYERDETFDPTPYQEPNSNNGDLEMGTAAPVGGKIELTTAPSSSASSSSNKEKRSEHESPDDVDVAGEEGSFSGTPVTTSNSSTKLLKRGNSRDRERGTLT